MPSTGRRGPLSRAGHWLRKVATFVYGPAELPDDVDPVVQLDREAGTGSGAPEPPRPSERQQSYDNLPRGTAE